MWPRASCAWQTTRLTCSVLDLAVLPSYECLPEYIPVYLPEAASRALTQDSVTPTPCETTLVHGLASEVEKECNKIIWNFGNSQQSHELKLL